MAEQGPPAFSRARHPLALRLVLSHKSISEDFFVNRDEATPPAPLVRSPKASLASDPNGGSSPTTTKARRPILLEEMILKVEKQGFGKVWSKFWSWSSGKILKLKFSQYLRLVLGWVYEGYSWSRFWSYVWSFSYVKMLIFGWGFEVAASSRLWNLIKICLRTCDMT